jgi:hypothetical protein
MSVASPDMCCTALSQDATLYYAATEKPVAFWQKQIIVLDIICWNADCYLVIHSIAARFRSRPD